VEERLFLGRLAAEHEQDREHFSVMQRCLLGATYGHHMDLREFLRAAGRYLDLQHRHMARENAQLLPLAESLLTEEDDTVLLRAFAALDASDPVGSALPERVDAVVRARSS
jgi:hemerythrin-like domain-containing protein